MTTQEKMYATPSIIEYFQEQPKNILDNAYLGICLLAHSGKIIYANQRCANIYGVSSSEMQDKRIHDFCRYTAQNFSDFLQKLDQEGDLTTQEMYINGCYYLYKIQNNPQHKQRFLIITLLDTTAYKRIELALQKSNQQLEYLCTLDRITGLNNMTAFEQEIRKIRAHAHSEPLGMILLDLDHFKKFNQENGYEYGDVAIQTVSHCLAQFIEPNKQLLFHLGGDEFMFILYQVQTWSVYTIAEQIIAAINDLDLYFSSGAQQRLTASLALESFQTGLLFEHEFFLVRLKHLIRQAKKLGGNRWLDSRSLNQR